MSEANMRDAMDVAWEKNKYEGEESFEADPFDMFRDGYYAACAHKDAEFANEREQFAESEKARRQYFAEMCEVIEKNEQLRAEIERLTEHLKDDCKCTIDRYERQLTEARALIAMQAEALQESLTPVIAIGACVAETKIRNAISTSAESVAAWESEKLAEFNQECTRSHPHERMTPMCELRTEIAELTNHLANAEAIANRNCEQGALFESKWHEAEDKLEPLRREVAMLNSALLRVDGYLPIDSTLRVSIQNAIYRTQATAEAYERELKAKALEEAANFYYNADWKETPRGVVISRSNLIKQLRDKAAELRAQSAQKKGGE